MDGARGLARLTPLKSPASIGLVRVGAPPVRGKGIFPPSRGSLPFAEPSSLPVISGLQAYSEEGFHG